MSDAPAKLKTTRPWVIFVVVVVAVLVVGVAIAVPLVLRKFKSDSSSDDPDIPPSGTVPAGYTPGIPPTVKSSTLTFQTGPAMDGLTKDKVILQQVFADDQHIETSAIAILIGHHSRTYAWKIALPTLAMTAATLGDETINASHTGSTLVYAPLTSSDSISFIAIPVQSDGTFGTASPISFPHTSDANFMACSAWDWGGTANKRTTLATMDSGTLFLTHEDNDQPAPFIVANTNAAIQSVVLNRDTTLGFVAVVGRIDDGSVRYMVMSPNQKDLSTGTLVKLPGRGQLWRLALTDDGWFLLVVRSSIFEVFEMDWQSRRYTSVFQFAYTSMHNGAIDDRGKYLQVAIGFDTRMYMVFTINTATWTVENTQSQTVLLDATHVLQNTAGPMMIRWLPHRSSVLAIVCDTMGHAETHLLTYPPLV